MNHKLSITFRLLTVLGFGLATGQYAAANEYQFGPTGIFGNQTKTVITPLSPHDSPSDYLTQKANS